MKVVTLLTLAATVALCHFTAQASTSDRVCMQHTLIPGQSLNKNGQTDAEILGWMPLPAGSNICNGFYQNPILPEAHKPLAAFNQNPINLSFVDAKIHNEGRSAVSDVIISQPQRLITGDIAYINRDPNNKQFDSVELVGHATLREPGKLIVGERGKMMLQSRAGDFENARYRLSLNPELPSRPSILETPTNSERTLTAQGKADQVHQLKPGLIEFDKATYSTCSPEAITWQLRSKHITLNQETGRGLARHSVLYVKKVPVFYMPYFSFPIDKRRESGVLFPTYSNTSLGGFSIQVPVYWNIAPNYDATISPRWFSKRGVQINTEFRYLTPSSHGAVYLNALPGDRAFQAFQNAAPQLYPPPPATRSAYQTASLDRLTNAYTHRGYLSWHNTTHFHPRWSSSIDYTRVGDDYYYLNFPAPRPLAINNQVLQQGDIKYTGDNWNFRGLLQTYQTLHPINLPPVSKPYSMLPRLTLSANYPRQLFGLTYRVENEFTYFTRNLTPGETIAPPIAQRLNVLPSITLPITGLAGYFTPSVQLAMTGYRVQNQPAAFANQTFASNITRALPIVNIDTGIYFDREVDFGKQSYQQTLEPRLFYLYVPYKDQSQIPLFDSAFAGFNYDLLFRTNRFTGLDRVGDAHQIAAALTTRFLDQETGQEKFRASIGQIYYFRDRRVAACVPTMALPNCGTPATGASNSKVSPLAGQLYYAINPLWNVTANLTWDIKTRRTQNGNLNFQYRPGGANRLINFGYNFLQAGDRLASFGPSNQTNLSQAMFSFAWPIKDRWQAVGSWTYNVSHERSQNFFYGLEYNNCCVAAQLVVGRTFSGLSTTNTPNYNKAVYFQIQLKGFGNFGSTNPVSVLGSIPGYQDRFGKL